MTGPISGAGPAASTPIQLLRRSVSAGGQDLRYLAFSVPRPAVMVISHERSGTHFLMNSIAKGYGYVAAPWIDLDYHRIPINFYSQQNLEELLGHLSRNRIANLIKSHHAVEFLEALLDTVLERTRIFYIHRDPVSVMVSFRRFVNHWRWREGPRRDNAVSFAGAEPEGHLMRYQMYQRRNMLHRWAAHVDGWVGAAAQRPHVRVVRYDQLRDNYAATLTGLGDLLESRPRDLTPPPPDVNVIARQVGEMSTDERDSLHSLALAEVGATMQRLGYA
jgi:hypothetical protein